MTWDWWDLPPDALVLSAAGAVGVVLLVLLAVILGQARALHMLRLLAEQGLANTRAEAERTRLAMAAADRDTAASPRLCDRV